MPPTILTISMISHILNLNIGYKSFCCCCNHFTPFLNPSINASEQTRCTSGIHTPLFRLIGHVAQARLFPLACFAAVVIPFILLLIIVLIAIVRGRPQTVPDAPCSFHKAPDKQPYSDRHRHTGTNYANHPGCCQRQNTSVPFSE